MRLHFILLFAFVGLAIAQDENSEDVFAAPVKDIETSTGDESVQAEEVNEGMDSFQASTEMIEKSTTMKPLPEMTSTSTNSTENSMKIEKEEISHENTPVQKIIASTSATTELKEESTSTEPIFSEAVVGERSEEQDPVLEIDENVGELTNSTKIGIDDVADRRVLKEKEELPLPILRAEKFTPQVTDRPTEAPSRPAVSDPSETEDSEDTPFDQSAAAGLFEADGSFIDSSLLPSANSPTFPIVQMTEEEPKIIGQDVNIKMLQKPEATKKTTTTSGPQEREEEEFEEPKIVDVGASEASTTTVKTTTTMADTSSEKASEEATDEEHEDEKGGLNSNVLANSSKVFAPAKASRTPMTIRITSIDFNDVFADIQSGPSRKLARIVVPRLLELLSPILQENLLDVDVVGLTKGSVVVHADILTKSGILDAQEVANQLEAAIAKNNSQIGDNIADSLSVTVDGLTSRVYIDSLANPTMNGSSSFILPFIIAFVVILLVMALIVIALSQRRRRHKQGQMKLSDDSLVHIENASSSYTNSQVHLMSYGGSEVLVNGEKVPAKSFPATYPKQDEREVS
ncbi:unnamed protein product [Caenorhabditis auriculariae]|uniref:SEA domain-containing protein n=1 Tax=Caenorhabditis auriculariae TaxID=2777116 RepID=A0A8S1H9K9_9PELO|nr:unnamed protein product [Caenorhabditis auriculariae]